MNCRSCGGDDLGEVIDLGSMPLVNNLLRSADEIAPTFPLHVVFCRECTLMQLTELPPPASMFDDYLYFSSQSQTMVDHGRDLVKRFVEPGDRVLEIASNDGYLLQHAQARGAKVLGIEPARNIAAHAESRGIPTRCAYFNQEIAEDILNEWGCADVIFANNVLAHVPDPNEVVAAIAMLLSDDRVAHIEVPSAMRMVEIGAFDTIYHEHACYFTLTALTALFARHGLGIVDVDMVDIHGGSFHLQVSRKAESAHAAEMLLQEEHNHVGTERFHQGLIQQIHRTRCDVLETLDHFDTVVGYGAAAKGVVLLNVLGLGPDRVGWVADVSPHKQGHFVPGTGQPIVSPRQLLEQRPDAALLLPWNIRHGVLSRNQRYRDQGGRFIVPIPKVEIV